MKEVSPTSAINPRLRWKIVITKTGQIVAWTGETAEFPVNEYAGCPFYPSWEVFEESTTAKEMRDLAIKYHVELPGKINKIDASLFIWDKLCSLAAVQNTVKSTTADPARKLKLKNRIYELVHLEGEDYQTRERTLADMTPQAKECLLILKEFGVSQVDELSFKSKLEACKDRLHTRQDSWRIFQYYRAALINARWIRLI
jgi:hypothetical protein